EDMLFGIMRRLLLGAPAAAARRHDAVRTLPGAALPAQIALPARPRLSGTGARARRQRAVFERVAERAEFLVRDAVQFELQLQLGHFKKQHRLAQATGADPVDELIQRRDGLLKPFVHARFHRPAPSNCPGVMSARSMSGS